MEERHQGRDRLRGRLPLIGDRDLKVAKLYDMLPAGAGETSEGRTPADNATVRSVYVIGPDKKIKLILTYPMTTGRNFNEILRAIDSIQLTAKHQVATPANWQQGEDVIITAAVSNEDAVQRFGSFEPCFPISGRRSSQRHSKTRWPTVSRKGASIIKG